MSVGGTLVLLYHRVTRLERDPHGLAVHPDRFAQHCEILQRRFSTVALSDWNRSGRHVAITFDDGYADNALEARSILAAAGLPATFFITVGPLGGRKEAWWDRLEQILLGADTAAAAVDIEIAGRPLWADVRSPAARERAHLALFWRMRSLRLAEIESALSALAMQLGTRSIDRQTHRWMSVDELRELSASDGIDIGAHTITHPFLATLDADDQWQEIEGSRQTLEGLLDRPTSLFSYPYGGPDALNEVTTGLVRKAGYTVACTATGGIARPDCDPLRIPRNVVGDWDADRFACWLDRWQSEL